MELKSKRTAVLLLLVAVAACKSPVVEPPPPPAPPATKAQLVKTLVQLSNMKPLRPAAAAALLGVRLGTEQTSGNAVSEWSMEPGPLVAGGTALRNGPYVDITFRPRPGLGLTFEDVAAQFLDAPFKVEVSQPIPHNLQAMVDDAGRAPRKFRVPAGELRVFLGTGPAPWNGRVQSVTVTDDMHPEWGGTETLREKRARQQPPPEPDDEAVSATESTSGPAVSPPASTDSGGGPSVRAVRMLEGFLPLVVATISRSAPSIHQRRTCVSRTKVMRQAEPVPQRRSDSHEPGGSTAVPGAGGVPGVRARPR